MMKRSKVREYAKIDGMCVVSFGDAIVYFESLVGRIEYNRLPLLQCNFTLESAIIDALTPEVVGRLCYCGDRHVFEGKTYDAGGSGMAYISKIGADDAEAALFNFKILTPVPDADFDTLSGHLLDTLLEASTYIEEHNPDRVNNTQEVK